VNRRRFLDGPVRGLAQPDHEEAETPRRRNGGNRRLECSGRGRRVQQVADVDERGRTESALIRIPTTVAPI